MKKICCFTGHSKLYGEDFLWNALLEELEKGIITEQMEEFWVGNYGQFDGMAARAVRKLKEKYPQITLFLVIPYLTKEINTEKERYYRDYDGILMADLPENTPSKFKIIKCNQYMIQNAQHLICFVKYRWGGAGQTLEYAQKQRHITISNLAEKKHRN